MRKREHTDGVYLVGERVAKYLGADKPSAVDLSVFAKFVYGEGAALLAGDTVPTGWMLAGFVAHTFGSREHPVVRKQ